MFALIAIPAFGQNPNPPLPDSNATSTDTTAQSEKIVINANQFSGSDVGARVNAAAATCAAGSICHIVIPPSGQLALTTPIVMTNAEELECSQSGFVQNTNQGASATQLRYTGTGTAITMNGRGDTLLGCNLLLDPSASVGVLMGGFSDHANQITVSGGDEHAILVHISGSGAEDIHLENSRLANFRGIGVQVDHANDTVLSNITAYGARRGSGSNNTSRTLVIDSAGNGTTITDFLGGNSGLHGLVVQNTIGAAPNWIFANNFQSDCSTGSGWLFDATLGSSMIGATFLNSWSSGAGTCGRTIAPGIAGIEIAGGVNIHIGGGSKVRSNSGDGILIRGNGVSNLQIEGNLITGNGFCIACSAATYSGIHIAAAAHTVQIIGNTLGNTFNANENQLYGVDIEAGVKGLVISNNLCDDNRASCFNPTLANVQSMQHLTVTGNVTTTDTFSPDQKLHGDLANFSGTVASPVAPHMSPVYGASNNSLFGFGGNLHFDGTSWRTDTDQGSNGAFGLLGTYKGYGDSCLYAVPSASPATGRTIPPTDLPRFCVFDISTRGVSVAGGVRPGTGLQHIRGAIGCRTAAAVGATCTSPAQSWAKPFADVNYTLTCSIDSPTGVPAITSVARSTARFTITVAALTAVEAGGSYDCIAIHD